MPFFGLTIFGLYFFVNKSLIIGFFLFDLITIFFTNNKFIKYFSDLNLENDKIILIGDHGYRSNIEIDPYNTFGGFYGFKQEDLDEVKTVQDVGLLIKKYLINSN